MRFIDRDEANITFSLQFSDEGLILGPHILSKWNENGLDLRGSHCTVLLSIAQKSALSEDVIVSIQSAAKYWRAGERALASIKLAQLGFDDIDADDVNYVQLAKRLIDENVGIKYLTQKEARKYDESQPRVPAGNGRASGQWASSNATANVVYTGRSAAKLKITHEMPKDAVEVTYHDGTTITDLQSPTGKLMAPPNADFHKVYTEGTQTITPWGINAAVGHYGIFDFQRDSSTNTYYSVYKHASNYAVGVFMAGAKYSKEVTHLISEGFASVWSSNYDTDREERKYWTSKGWDDGHSGKWK